MGLKYTKIDSQEPKESNDVRFIVLHCIVFQLSACENLAKTVLTLFSTNTSQVVPAQSRTRDKTYPDFFTSKSYPVFTEVYHLVPADHQVVPE